MKEFADTIGPVFIVTLCTLAVVGVYRLMLHIVAKTLEVRLDYERRQIDNQTARANGKLVTQNQQAMVMSRAHVEAGALYSQQFQVLLADIDSRRLPQPVPSSLHYAPKYPNRIEQSQMPQIEEKPTPAVEVRDIWQLWTAGMLPDAGFLMGYNLEDTQPVVADWEQLYSALVGGMSGSGKSTLIRNVLIQSALQGGRFVVLDRHFGAGEQSLGASLQPLRSLMLCDVAATERQMVDALRWVLDIGRRRLRGQDDDDSPLILVVDETTAMLQRSNIVTELGTVLGEIAQETRKKHVYALCIGQNFSAEIMPTTIRNSFSSFISCRARRDVARVMSGNNRFGQAAAELKTGQAVWMDTNGNMMRLAVPNATQRHVELVARQCITSGRDAYEIRLPQEGSQTSMPGDVEVNGKSEIVPFDARAQRAIQMFESGKTQSEIIAEVWSVETSGRNAQSAAFEFQNIIREYIYQLRGSDGR